MLAEPSNDTKNSCSLITAALWPCQRRLIPGGETAMDSADGDRDSRRSLVRALHPVRNCLKLSSTTLQRFQALDGRTIPAGDQSHLQCKYNAEPFRRLPAWHTRHNAQLGHRIRIAKHAANVHLARQEEPGGRNRCAEDHAQRPEQRPEYGHRQDRHSRRQICRVSLYPEGRRHAW